ncbi:hypothetical protein WN48_11287 [Eufriesea mexicana]|uniref:Uncharacterized protein n=1 Tax=Eufriesea mexicana TaxID=516756 RepID=A0A310SE72_9HYME|nr:hypothetical protein WN48_11287 [Eufriesea mexicana]
MYVAAHTWLGEELELGGPFGVHRYLSLLHEGVIRFMQSEWRVPSERPTRQEWVQTGKWMEGKAATGSSLMVEVEGRKTQSVRGKGVDGYYMTDTQIVDELAIPLREQMHVMQKPEGAKIWGVVKTGNSVNRKMS